MMSMLLFCFLFVVPISATLPVIELSVSKNITVLEESTVSLSVSINATPPVNTSSIQWLLQQFGVSSPFDITTSSLLGDGQTRLALSSDRLSLTLRNVSTRSSGIYTIVATNVAGTSQNFFVVNVQSELFMQ